jgi:hypothetical protein
LALCRLPGLKRLAAATFGQLSFLKGNLCDQPRSSSQVTFFSRGGSTKGEPAANQWSECSRECRWALLTEARADFADKIEVFAAVGAKHRRGSGASLPGIGDPRAGRQGRDGLLPTLTSMLLNELQERTTENQRQAARLAFLEQRLSAVEHTRAAKDRRSKLAAAFGR